MSLILGGNVRGFASFGTPDGYFSDEISGCVNGSGLIYGSGNKVLRLISIYRLIFTYLDLSTTRL